VITHAMFSREELGAGSGRLFMAPRDVPGQHVHSHRLDINPVPNDRTDHIDLYGNRFTYFAVDHPHRLSITAISEIDLHNCRPLTDPAERWESARAEVGSDPLVVDFVLPSGRVELTAEIAAFAAVSFVSSRPLLDCLNDLAQRIAALRQPGSTTTDLAHFAVACFRSMGLASRFVTGYVESPNSSMAVPLVGAGSLHAWAAVRDASGIWIDVDPSNALVEPVSHLALGWGRDGGDIDPLRRAEARCGAGAVTIESTVEVRRASRRDGRQRGSLKAGRERLKGLC